MQVTENNLLIQISSLLWLKTQSIAIACRMSYGMYPFLIQWRVAVEWWICRRINSTQVKEMVELVGAKFLLLGLFTDDKHHSSFNMKF